MGDWLQSEHHRHLDVSLRPQTTYELAQGKGLIGESTSFEKFFQKFMLLQPLSSLSRVLDQFALFQSILDRPEAFERIAFEACEDVYQEGTRKIEFRFSPSFITEKNKLPWDDVLIGIQNGVRRAREHFSDLQVGLICIASRDYGPDEAYRTVEFFQAKRADFVAFDLAGKEIEFPNRYFAEALKPIQGEPITIHAGEADGPDSVWEAVENLGARRIGHGIRSIEDPHLVETLAKQQICLEVCPQSNYITQSVKRLSEHPLPHLIRAGVATSLNTDDPGIFGTTLPQEIELCRQHMGLSEDDVDWCLRSGHQFSFLD